MRNKPLLVMLLLLISSCDDKVNDTNKKEYRQFIGFTMGTTYQITIESTQQEQHILHQKIDSRLIEINQLMSTYIKDSELSLFNKNESLLCIPMSQENLFVIKQAVAISKQTNGKFDVTLDPLIKEWGFDTKQTNDHIPSNKIISKLLEKIGYSKLHLEKDCIQKDLKSLSINLSAIAKGYGVDQIANVISNHGIQNYLVEIGGETASKGQNSKSINWRLAIEAPIEKARQIQKVFEPKDLGVATSGNYRNYFDKDGVRYSHTIDPTTGKPITHNLASVTVLHEQTMMADAYATAFMVMGSEESLIFAESKDLAIYLLVKTKDGFVERYSSEFLKHLPNESRD
ncbi:MAG: FAD:protein FMN transferase ApbE [Kangiella sp.]|nr:MAG: FAD:protein FMN transferase ApbE [Kangiella sp.]